MIRTFVELIILLCLSTGAAAFTWKFHPQSPSYTESRLDYGEVTLQEALTIDSQTLVWIDARSEAEFNQSHIPGAIHLNEDNWESGLEVLLTEVDIFDPTLEIIVYCDGASCQVSKAVSTRLREELGLEQVRFLHNGWAAWIDNESS